MHFFARHRENIRQSAMSARLLWPCLLLVVLLVLTFGAALFLFASLHNTKKDTTRSLEIQFSVFQNDVERYFDQLAVMGVNLSADMSALVDQQLAERKMTFDRLNDSPEVLNALEEEMIEPLCRSLRQTSCSGAFVLLDATVNTRMEGAEHSRAGLYVQKSGADTP
ncbi:MAG: LuxR family transcriptional regulator, partial [Faecalibacterium prausnitzii]